MKKKQRVFWTIVLLFDCVASVTSLCVAWFTSNQKANSGIGSIVATNGMTAELKTFSSDGTSDITEYDYLNEACSYTYDSNNNCTNPQINGTYTYADNFKSSSSLTLRIPYVAPTYAYTFAVELSGGIPSSTCTAKMSKYYASYIVDSAKRKVNLSRISSFNFMAGNYSSKDTNLESFLKTPTTTNLKNADNFFGDGTQTAKDSNAKFYMTQASSDSKPETGYNTFSINDTLTGYSATLFSFTLDSTGHGLVFMTLYFSNLSSTYYTKTTVDSSDVWTKDTSGDSNIYADQKIKFDSIVFECGS